MACLERVEKAPLPSTLLDELHALLWFTTHTAFRPPDFLSQLLSQLASLGGYREGGHSALHTLMSRTHSMWLSTVAPASAAVQARTTASLASLNWPS